MSYRLNIFGTDYSEWTLIDSVNITYGRSSLSDQPSPATFNATLVVDAGVVIPDIGLDYSFNFQVYDNYATAWVNLFSGYITDVSIGTYAWGNGSGIIQYQVTGLGHLSRFNRVNVGTTGFVKAYAGTRIYDIMLDGPVPLGVAGINTPGDYEIAAVSNGNYDALQLAQDAANSANGVLVDTPDDDDTGLKPVEYKTYLDRSTAASFSLTTGDVMANGINLTKSMNDIVNKAWLTYGSNGSTNGTIYTDPFSNYDIQSASRTTYLHNVSDANTLAQILLAARENELYKITSLTVDVLAISDATASSLYGVRVGQRFTIDSLPFTEVSAFDGFVEGWSWQINRNGSTITLNVSNYGQNFPYTLWNQLNNTDTWNTIYTSTTTWEDVV